MDDQVKKKLADNIGALRLAADGLKDDTLTKDDVSVILMVVSKSLAALVSRSSD